MVVRHFFLAICITCCVMASSANAALHENRRGGPQVLFIAYSIASILVQKTVINHRNGCLFEQRRLHVSPNGFELDEQQNPPQRAEWPHVLGMDAEEAKQLILNDIPDSHQVHIVPQKSMVTMDYRKDRVRIFVDTNQKVVRTPKIG
jgi:hypothetical protein